MKDGNVTFNVIGIHYGRLGLHPVLKGVGAFGLSGVKEAFDKDLKGLSRLSDVQIGDGVIQFTTKPAQ
jgi:hypothetical protein